MATEEERILDIKVNHEEAINNIADYKQKIDELKEAEKQYKKEVQDGTMSQQEYNKRITAARLAAKEYRTAINVLEKSISSQIKTQKSNADILADVDGLIGKNVRSIAEAEAANKALREAVRSLSDDEESAYEIRQKLNAQIDENTNYIRRNSDEYIRSKMNVGNYTESIKQAFVEIKNGSFTMQSAGIIAKGYADILNKDLRAGWESATRGGNTFAGVLKLVKTAIIATGIGALLIALTSVAAAFARTQQGMETFQRVSAMIGSTIDVVLDRIAMLGTAIVNVFKGDFKGAAEAAKSAITGIGKEIREEAKAADELRIALIAIEKEETMLKMSRAANKAEIEALKKVAEDTTKSEKERLEAAKRAYEIEQKDMDAQVRIQKARVANMLGYVEMTEEVEATLKDMATGAISADEAISKIGISSSTIDDLKELSDAVVEMYEVEESSTTRQIELQNKLNSIRKESKDAYLERMSKETDAIREMEDALLNIIKDNQERQRKEIELSYDREIEDLQKRLDTEKDLTSKARDAIIETIKTKEKEKELELNKLNDEAIAKEIDRQQKLIQLQLDAVKDGSEQEYQLKMQQLVLQRDAELQNKELTEQMKLAIVDKYNKLMNDATVAYNNEVAQKQSEALKVQFETAIAKAYGNEQEILRLQMEQKKAELDAMAQLEGESIEAYNLKRLQAENEYTQAKQEYADKQNEIEQSKLAAASAITGGLIELTEAIGESNRAAAIASKVLALAQIAIDTGKAISAGVAEAVKIGFPQNIVAIATTVAAVLANMISAIKTVKGAKFATGGDVSGPGTGTSDSIPAMLSNGESVLTARATSMFAPILSAFNQAGGGVPIQGQQTGNQAMGEDMLARAFAKGLSLLPSPVVSVEEITTVSNRVKAIENISRI